MIQAKIGIFIASIIGGIIGYIILNRQAKTSKDISRIFDFTTIEIIRNFKLLFIFNS
jgi:hypothetical protein